MNTCIRRDAASSNNSGVNFDRIWQGVASDNRYDSATSRAIAVVISYIMFLLDKFSPSRYIVTEIEEANR